MRIFAIKDDTLSENTVLGFLIYYEKAKAFYIELPDDADPWDTPPILSSFAKRGEYSINSYWSRNWVEQRVIPQDRQNIGQIIKENGLKEYDEFLLLLLANGRCAQDDCYLEEVSAAQIPLLQARWQTKIDDVIALTSPNVLVFFRNGEVRIVNIKNISDAAVEFEPFLVNQDRFDKVEVQTDGYGIIWNEKATVSDRKLYEAGTEIPLSLKDFCRFVQHRVINATEASELLGCSRQNIDDLMRRDKLHPIRRGPKHKLFLKSEVLQRKNI